MSIYIRDMKMPKNCHGCDFFCEVNVWKSEDEADVKSFCRRTGEKTFEAVYGFLPNCPLLEIQPHGRLGDLDKLEAEWKNFDHGVYYDKAAFVSSIQLSPTIIPGDRLHDQM